MEKMIFDAFLKAHAQQIAEIRDAAWALHERVGQSYDHTLPYGHHLSMVADAAIRYGAELVASASDILPVVFAAYFHDSIEDARLTYNDVLEMAGRFMTPDQSIIAAEIVYALTNDKGRTRSERAGEHYYAGIRATPYAPFVKLCDRLANMTYSLSRSNDPNNTMFRVYQSEWPHFIVAIQCTTDDPRFALPNAMIAQIEDMLA